jgi:hypothetical protein
MGKAIPSYRISLGAQRLMNGLGKKHIYSMEHYSSIKKNEIRSSAEKWVELEIILLNEIS